VKEDVRPGIGANEPEPPGWEKLNYGSVSHGITPTRSCSNSPDCLRTYPIPMGLMGRM
jgi:hypothetical protein